MSDIGITTTVPVEIIFAAGDRPVDLNNLFITSPDYLAYIDLAERSGFPKSLCSWIKGIYGATIKNGIKKIVGVVEGDCSNTNSLVAILESNSIEVLKFGYPHSHSKNKLRDNIQFLYEQFGVCEVEVNKQRIKLNKIRKLALEVDRLTWQEGKISGFDNHLSLVSMSDFYGGNLELAKEELSSLIENAKLRKPREKSLRIGYIGVPPMPSDLFDVVETFNSSIIYNEVQREFSFPRFAKAKNIVDQYWDYTYPYSIDFRIKEIQNQIKKRKLDAIIHYTQSFCHRALDDIIIRKMINIPILTIEGDRSNLLDARTKLRLEAFLDMMVDVKIKGVKF